MTFATTSNWAVSTSKSSTVEGAVLHVYRSGATHIKAPCNGKVFASREEAYVHAYLDGYLQSGRV